MSHAKERKEKNCLNCNAIVAGRYCQVCGQENIETHETFAHLAGHFISDIFHFDGMFFSTAEYLLFKPGFLTHEYMRGRRASYLNPIKMYFFVSAVFFLFFLSVYKPEVKVDNDDNSHITAAQTMKKLKEIRDGLTELLAEKVLPAASKGIVDRKLALIDKNIGILEKDTTDKVKLLAEVNDIHISSVGAVSISDTGGYHSAEAYDSMQEKLPAAKRDNWFQRRYQHRTIEFSEEIRKNEGEAINNLMENVYHRFPQVLFISLPIIALVLQVLYTRRKTFTYASHAIFAVLLYSALFVFLFLALLINKLDVLPYLSWLIWVNYAIIIYIFYYTWQAMHSFYGQGWGKTTVKWLLLNIVAFVVMSLLAVLLFMFTLFVM